MIVSANQPPIVFNGDCLVHFTCQNVSINKGETGGQHFHDIFTCYLQISKGMVALHDGTEVRLQEFLDRPDAMFYIGITKHADIEKEDLGFMKRRGAMVKNGKFGKRVTEPPILKPNGGVIPASQARRCLGFKSIILDEFGSYYNACRVEGALHRTYKEEQKMPFGSKILWTVSGAGGTSTAGYKKWDLQNAEAGTPCVVKLFLT